MTTLYSPKPVAFTKFTSTSFTEGSVPASFDASLYRPLDRGGQLKLTIYLRIKLRQLPPKPFMGQLDAGGRPFWTSPWNGPDWQRFIIGAAAQADTWNNKFWLVPPTTFSEFDIVVVAYPNQALRPNIRCELVVDFDPKKNAHRTIDVANLDTKHLTGRLSSGTFRSHALLYDSLDNIPVVFQNEAGPGQPVTHYTIAHEIGHAMGLGHIGTILKTPLCEFIVQQLGDDSGRNHALCYGFRQGRAVAGNVMGYGDRFTVENARPWVWAISSMFKRTSESARAVTSDPGPASVRPRFA